MSQSISRDDWWLKRRPLRSSGPLLYRDYRRLPPTPIASLQAMLAEVYRRHPQSPRLLWPAGSVLRGFLASTKHACLSLVRYGSAAKREYGRSYAHQGLDMARAWWRNSFPPLDYYSARLARYGGSKELFNYVGLYFIHPVLREIQLDRYGMPSVEVNDKGCFGAWLRSQGFPSPREIMVDGDRPVFRSGDLERLGNRVVVKLRASGKTDGIEFWDRDARGHWYAENQTQTTPAFLEHLRTKASQALRGIVIQERLTNHPQLQDLCGEALSTCRVVTVRNEKNDPEVVDFHWRIAMGPKALVDTVGGVLWPTRDPQTAEIDHGVGPDTTRLQRSLTHNPLNQESMIGSRHPMTREMQELALAVHSRLPDLFLAGFDIAACPQGPVVIELNSPPGTTPRTFTPFDGFEPSRFGEILSWHAQRWIERHVPAESKRRIGSQLNPGATSP